MSLLSQQVVGVRNPDKLRGCAPKKPISRYTPEEEAANREIEQRMIAALTPKVSKTQFLEPVEVRNQKFLDACRDWTPVSEIAKSLGWSRAVFGSRATWLRKQGKIEARGCTNRREYRAVPCEKVETTADIILAAVEPDSTSRTIANATGFHVSTVSSTLANLARQGKVERIRRGGDLSFIYRRADQ